MLRFLVFVFAVSITVVFMQKPGSFESKAYATGAWIHHTAVASVTATKSFVTGVVKGTSPKQKPDTANVAATEHHSESHTPATEDGSRRSLASPEVSKESSTTPLPLAPVATVPSVTLADSQ